MSWAHVAVVAVTSIVAAAASAAADALHSFWTNQAAAMLMLGVACVELLPDGTERIGSKTACAVALQTAAIASFAHDALHARRASPEAEDTDEMVCRPCDDPLPSACARCSHSDHAPPSSRSSATATSASTCAMLAGSCPIVVHVVLDGAVLGMVQKADDVAHVGCAVGLCVVQDTFALSRWLRVVARDPRARIRAWCCCVAAFSASTLSASAAAAHVGTDWGQGALSSAASGLLLPVALELCRTPSTLRQRAFTLAAATAAAWYFWVVDGASDLSLF